MNALAPAYPAGLPGTAVLAQRLTPAQLQVLEEYVRLGSQKAVGAALGISYQTVKNHLSAIYRRCGTLGILETLSALGWVTPPGVGPLPCGWVGTCARIAGHEGPHGAFREWTT